MQTSQNRIWCLPFEARWHDVHAAYGSGRENHLYIQLPNSLHRVTRCQWHDPGVRNGDRYESCGLRTHTTQRNS